MTAKEKDPSDIRLTADFITKSLDKLRMTQKELLDAIDVDMDRSGVSAYKSGKTEVPGSFVLKVQKLLDEKQLSGLLKSVAKKATPLNQFEFIPKYAARPSGGPGSNEISDRIEANLAFRKEWIASRGNKKDLALFEVRGDSMLPTIADGDVVLVDKSVTDITNGKIYVFREGNEIYVKRLARKAEKIVVTFDNKAEGNEYPAATENFKIFGRVIWVGHVVD